MPAGEDKLGEDIVDEWPAFLRFNAAFLTHALDEEEGGIPYLESEKCICNIELLGRMES